MYKLSIEELEYLFRMIKINGDIEPLLEKCGYQEIAIALKEMVEEGYAIYSEKAMELTQLGLAEYDRISMVLNRKRNKWILPKIEAEICKVPEDFIYLPSKVDDF